MLGPEFLERQIKSDQVDPKQHELARELYFFFEKKFEDLKKVFLEISDREAHGLLAGIPEMGTKDPLDPLPIDFRPVGRQ